ncbi:DUF4384 domain-containing protein, partial [candidate division KSB1 bacterium]|nr:DUF4384 domain-containing protein [candidate division KSB1 bacterium]
MLSNGKQEHNSLLDNMPDSSLWEFRAQLEIFARLVMQRIPVDGRNGTIAIGKFTVDGRYEPCPFSLLLRQQLEWALESYTSLTVLPAEKIRQEVHQQSIQLKGPAPNRLEGILNILESDLFINGSCQENDHNIIVWMLVYEKRSKERIFSKKMILNKQFLPYDLIDESEKEGNTVNVQFFNEYLKNSHESKIHVDLWVDKLDGVYREDDKMVVYLRSSEAAFIKLFYLNTRGDLCQLFPNKFYRNEIVAADSVIKLGDEDDPFDFVTTPPFGVELLFVLASNKRFLEIDSQETADGFY